MSPLFAIPRRAALRVLALAAALTLAACVPVTTATGPAGGGPAIDPSAPVPVALLVPGESGRSGDAVISRGLRNAARLAIADLQGVRIDLRDYETGGSQAGAAAAARRAIEEGARIIVGPLYSEAANGAGLAAASQGVNVLAFSNNPAIAGGNVFILGNTFRNTAERLTSYAARQGRGNIFVVSGRAPSEEAGRQAIARAIATGGARLAGSATFPLSQQGLTAAAPQIVADIEASGAEAVFFTSDNAGAMPFLAQLLPEQGLDPNVTKFIGLTRLDIPPEALSQPGLQGAWFALPDPTLSQRFRSRYRQSFGQPPHPLAGLAYDGIAAVGALVQQGRRDALTGRALTTASGFVGVNGIFRFRPDGTNQRALAVAEIRNRQVTVIDPAPRGFGGAGF
jgi:ABC-type branched-subunit amino acid transport system substrate-binding protein